VRTGSLQARWDGLEVQLGFAPQMINGQPYVHTLDLHKTIQPLLEGGARLRLGSNPVLVIDPGHGGENAGTRSVFGDHYEKEFTLDWALRLQKLLVDSGWQVFLTRSNDSDLALSNRVAVAADHKADLFLSLHFNSAAPDQSEAGLETYCLTPAGMPSSLTRGFGDEMGVSFPNNAFDAQNLWLALSVQRALLQVNGHNDRGVRRARFPAVLRGQQRPAVLIEGGYLSNPTEARRISNPGYRQRLAEAVASALTGGGLVARAVPRQEGTNGSHSVEASSPGVQVGGNRSGTAGQRAEVRRQNSEETSHTAEIP
jgi:N-acetylmuramoyl-L-alanine amidase